MPLEIELLADHGIAKPPNMVGLTDDQIEELKLKDEWSDRSYPSGGSVFNADGVGRRTGSGTALLACLRNVISECCCCCAADDAHIIDLI